MLSEGYWGRNVCHADPPLLSIPMAFGGIEGFRLYHMSCVIWILVVMTDLACSVMCFSNEYRCTDFVVWMMFQIGIDLTHEQDDLAGSRLVDDQVVANLR